MSGSTIKQPDGSREDASPDSVTIDVPFTTPVVRSSLKRAGIKVDAMNRFASPLASQSVSPYQTWTAPVEPMDQTEQRFVIDRCFQAVGAKVPCSRALTLVNGTMPEWGKVCVASAPLGLVDAMLRGSSQVIMVNNSLSGFLILLALFIPAASGDPAAWGSAALVGVAGLLSLFGSTAFSILTGIDSHAVQAGLFGYNGLLVGLGLATFLDGGWDIQGVKTLVLSPFLGALSVLLQCGLGNLLVPAFKCPPFTLAFNATMIWFVLGSASRFSHFHVRPFLAPAISTLSTAADADPYTPSACAELHSLHVAWVLRAAVTSIGQIFLCGSWPSGLLILLGAVFCSRIMAMALFFGALQAVLLSLLLGAPCAEIEFGLWGYNSALTATAVVTFFVPTRITVLMAALGVFLTVILDGAFKQAMAPFGAPAGTLPFCFAAILLVLAQGKVPGFAAVPLADVATPEDHFISIRTDASPISPGSPRKSVILAKKKKRGV